jgi:hypothetical protein
MSPAVEKPPLSQGVAYGIVLGQLITPRRVYELIIFCLGFGIVFSLTMNAITWLGRRYLSESSVRAF